MSCQQIETFISTSIKYPETTIKLKSPKELMVGQDQLILVETTTKRNLPIILIITNDLVTHSYPLVTNKKEKLSKNFFIHSGLYTFAVSYKDSILTKRRLWISPAAISNPLNIYTGPASIVTGGKQPSMIVTVPSDSFGNGFIKPVNIKYQKLNLEKERRNEKTNHLFASYKFTSGLKAQKTLIGISSQTALANEQSILETPDWPNTYSIAIASHHPYADNRQYLRVQTDQIKDQHGNQVADGTQVSFFAYEDENLVAQYVAITIDGVANVYMRNPIKPKTWKISSAIGLTTGSNTLTISFKENITELLLEYDVFAKKIIVGPLKSPLGQYSPDGTEVTMNYEGTSIMQETIKGMTVFDLMKLGIPQKGIVTIMASDLKDQITL